jgi:hypothetical protein
MMLAMNTALESRRQRRRRSTRVTLVICTSLALAVTAWAYAPAWLAYSRYAPQEGDIVFQSLPYSRLINAIEGATGSPLSHCGIVAKSGDEWVVYEAYRNVEATPLRKFIFRGRDHGFAVYRLRQKYRDHIPAMLKCGRGYLGRPYDTRYRLDDERIYCSELVYKAYLKASGGELGKLVALRDLHWQPHREIIERYEGGPPPLDRQIITPKHLAQAPQLELVTAHRIEPEPADQSDGRPD